MWKECPLEILKIIKSYRQQYDTHENHIKCFPLIQSVSSHLSTISYFVNIDWFTSKHRYYGVLRNKKIDICIDCFHDDVNPNIGILFKKTIRQGKHHMVSYYRCDRCNGVSGSRLIYISPF